MSSVRVGIDPGACGCVAVFGEDAPTFVLLDTGDPYAVADTLRTVAARDRVERVVIERTHTMPKMGASSAFTFGQSTGVLLGVCAALVLPVVRASAQSWQKVALAGRGIPSERPERMAAIVRAAMEFWPALDWPKAKKHREALSSALWLGECASPALTARARESSS